MNHHRSHPSGITNRNSYQQARHAMAIAAAVLSTSGAHAEMINQTGNISFHNDVVRIPFTIPTAATNVRVWTDSFQSNTNFDPITALWDSSGNLLGQNDDNPGIALGQTYYDSGLVFSSLSAGEYLFTVTTYANFARGTNISTGFAYGGQTPIPLASWSQPANQVGPGSYYSLWVDAAGATIPDPGSSQSNPLLPTVTLPEGGFSFGNVVVQSGGPGSPGSVPMWFDPFVAVGYEFNLTSGPLFGTLTLPNLPDLDGFQIEYDGEVVATVASGGTFDFTTLNQDGASFFRILDIEPDLMIDPTNPGAFAAGFNFMGAGSPEFTMTPMTVFVVPEPSVALLLLTGALPLIRRRRHRC